jgi:ribosome-associated toxin RatA of RatAB toxin-antitoxin module
MAAAERSEVIDIPLRKFFDVVRDFSRYPEFVSSVKKTQVLSKDDHKARVHFDIELMKRLEYAIDLQEEFDPEYKWAKLSWTLAESKFFKVNNGLWSLKALGPDKTEVLYRLELEFTFSVPGFVLKTLVAGALPKTIQEFVDRARKV